MTLNGDVTAAILAAEESDERAAEAWDEVERAERAIEQDPYTSPPEREVARVGVMSARAWAAELRQHGQSVVIEALAAEGEPP